MPALTITEPHPTVKKNSYTHSGRGGAGNIFRAPSTTSPTGVPTHAPAPKASSSRFHSGRGGAGNAHKAAARPALSFDEECERADHREKASLGHVGRGGAGNVFGSNSNAAKKDRQHSGSSTGSRRDSSSTSGSERSGFWRRLSIHH